MFSVHIEAPLGATATQLERSLKNAISERPRCLLVYADVTCAIDALNSALAAAFPSVPTAGCTSFLGVGLSSGYRRGVGILVFEERDAISAVTTMFTCHTHSARAAAERAAGVLEQQLGGLPDMVLLHATPGFEETLLEGLNARLPGVPVFGGSAADDNVNGGWSVFGGGRSTHTGAALVGLRSPRRISGGFVGGYLPSEHSGIVTRAEGRIVHEIDGKPAAQVYNAWSNGAIAGQLRGGRILSETNLLPLARSVVRDGVLPRRLLAHPERVIGETGSLAFFSRFQAGDAVLLMTSTKGGLIPRMRRATERAAEGQLMPRGGLWVYCAGCLSSTPDDGAQIGQQFKSVVGDVPFIGISTFGEQGSFFTRGSNYHGNLMCSAVLFE